MMQSTPVNNSLKRKNVESAFKPYKRKYSEKPVIDDQQSQTPTPGSSQQENKGINNSKLMHSLQFLNKDYILQILRKDLEQTKQLPVIYTYTENSVDDEESEEYYKIIRDLLNSIDSEEKLSEVVDIMFDKEYYEMIRDTLNKIDSEEKLTEAVNFIFDKAVNDPEFTKPCAILCDIYSIVELNWMENGQQLKVKFWNILIKRCNEEFENFKFAQLDSDKWLGEIKNCNDPVKKEELQLAYEEKRWQIRMKSLGSFWFIGILLKLGVLCSEITYNCFEYLLQTPEDVSLECLCFLLSVIGQDLAPAVDCINPLVSLNPYFLKMSDIAEELEGPEVSPRVRFMVQDVLAFCMLMLRAKDNNPEEVNKEEERLSVEMTMAVNEPVTWLNVRSQTDPETLLCFLLNDDGYRPKNSITPKDRPQTPSTEGNNREVTEAVESVPKTKEVTVLYPNVAHEKLEQPTNNQMPSTGGNNREVTDALPKTKEVTVLYTKVAHEKLEQPTNDILMQYLTSCVLLNENFSTVRDFMNKNNSEERLTEVINLFYNMAVNEPNFTKPCANFCKMCSKLEVVKMENGQELTVKSSEILMTRCEKEFESIKSAELDSGKFLEEIKNCNDPVKKKELQLAYEENKCEIQTISSRNISLMGELFEMKVLSPVNLYNFIEYLLQSPEDGSLERLCELLNIIEKNVESVLNTRDPLVLLNSYFQKIYELSQEKVGSKVSSRVRFMLQDLVRLFKWVPRKEDPNPEQMNIEAERESTEITTVPNQPSTLIHRMNDLEIKDGGHSSSSVLQDIPQTPSTEGDNREVTEAVPKTKEVTIVDSKVVQGNRKYEIILEEYMADSSVFEMIRADIEQVYQGHNLSYFLQRALRISLEMEGSTQIQIGQLISYLMDCNLFSPDNFIEQFSVIYVSACYIAMNVPTVWELLAQVIGPIFAAENINFNDFKKAYSCVSKMEAAPKLLIPVLNFLVKEKGEGFARRLWNASNVSLEEFLPADTNLDAFIKENSLMYLTDDATSSSCQLSMHRVRAKIMSLMRTNQPYENILEFISSTLRDEVDYLHFIRALISAICQVCIRGNSLDKTRFAEYKKVIQQYVDNKEDRELACLSSVHLLSLEHPQGLLEIIFNHFLDENIVRSESFLKWRDHDEEKLENKDVSLHALASFFSALEHVDTDIEKS